MLKNINLDKLLKKWSNQELWNMVFSFWWSKPNWSMKHWLIITLLDFSMTLDYWDSLLTQELLTTKLVELFTNSLTTILMGDCLLIHIISDQGMLNYINLDKLMLFIILSILKNINLSNLMSFSIFTMRICWTILVFSELMLISILSTSKYWMT